MTFSQILANTGPLTAQRRAVLISATCRRFRQLLLPKIYERVHCSSYDSEPYLTSFLELAPTYGSLYQELIIEISRTEPTTELFCTNIPHLVGPSSSRLVLDANCGMQSVFFNVEESRFRMVGRTDSDNTFPFEDTTPTNKAKWRKCGNLNVSKPQVSKFLFFLCLHQSKSLSINCKTRVHAAKPVKQTWMSRHSPKRTLGKDSPWLYLALLRHNTFVWTCSLFLILPLTTLNL